MASLRAAVQALGALVMAHAAAGSLDVNWHAFLLGPPLPQEPAEPRLCQRCPALPQEFGQPSPKPEACAGFPLSGSFVWYIRDAAVSILRGQSGQQACQAD
jgi:hypothetical protein